MGTHFQEEIIINILSSLPANSLFRFKCVSKSWKTIISEPYFKKKHLNHAKNQKNSQKMLIRQMCYGKDAFYFYCSSLSSSQIIKDVQKLDCPSNFERGFCKIYCCCDGLFLIGIQCRPRHSRFLLWNPTTRESIILPHHTNFSMEYYSFYGLGYDPTSDDYKVLKVVKYEEVPNLFLLSLKSGSWRQIDGSSNSDHNSLLSSDGMDCLAFVNGAFHWLASTRRSNCWFSVISFNISDEVYREVPLPEGMSKTFDMIDHGVTVLGGMLCISCVYCNETTFFDLWVMKNYSVKESWIKLFSMKDTRIPSIIPIIPKGVTPDGEVLFRCGRRSVFMKSKGPYRLSDLTWSLDSDHIDKYTLVRGYVYTESLITPEVNH